ncbi:hypothetical protein P8S54_11125 (plasmid) [Thiomicrospira sp. R3]|uniref:hypothetical protein n=1 Tax=Thiomicrospira sp. R3 TaxID=3035472 RepID=UPI00259B364A|nr:hypothetical protein [Thiomicrospira sp. R3]WFE69828.1 hypothetical protein P8S54_11065 [Thiomicrospira sp. R3]WFE69840.1 hypothetical protein P8S54_11125 [Thiomicrospira sp. R3]
MTNEEENLIANMERKSPIGSEYKAYKNIQGEYILLYFRFEGVDVLDAITMRFEDHIIKKFKTRTDMNQFFKDEQKKLELDGGRP